MQAIEFITQAKDDVIEIPKQYLKDLKGKFRVLILMDEDQSDELVVTENQLQSPQERED